MDQALLVDQGQALTRRLDETPVKPRAVMWVHQEDADSWKLWIVPDESVQDKREFYRIVAETMARFQDEVKGLDIGATQFVSDDHPAMQGMGGFIHLTGVGSVQFEGNRFNGFYLPEGIVIRMAL